MLNVQTKKWLIIGIIPVAIATIVFFLIIRPALHTEDKTKDIPRVQQIVENSSPDGFKPRLNPVACNQLNDYSSGDFSFSSGPVYCTITFSYDVPEKNRVPGDIGDVAVRNLMFKEFSKIKDEFINKGWSETEIAKITKSTKLRPKSTVKCTIDFLDGLLHTDNKFWGDCSWSLEK